MKWRLNDLAAAKGLQYGGIVIRHSGGYSHRISIHANAIEQ
jgi:hypothetical protein